MDMAGEEGKTRVDLGCVAKGTLSLSIFFVVWQINTPSKLVSGWQPSRMLLRIIYNTIETYYTSKIILKKINSCFHGSPPLNTRSTPGPAGSGKGNIYKEFK